MGFQPDDNSQSVDTETFTLLASDGGQSPLNRILSGLRNEHRRYILYYLQEERSCDFNEAARRVAAWKYGCNIGDVPLEVLRRTKSELYHIHVPKLDALNIIDHDDRTGVLRYHEPPEGLDDFLDLARQVDGLD